MVTNESLVVNKYQSRDIYIDIKDYLSIITSDKVSKYSQKLATGRLEYYRVFFDIQITDHMMDGSHNYDEISKMPLSFP